MEYVGERVALSDEERRRAKKSFGSGPIKLTWRPWLRPGAKRQQRLAADLGVNHRAGRERQDPGAGRSVRPNRKNNSVAFISSKCRSWTAGLSGPPALPP